jgi:crotonobetainyl-CoA:carnitine CoA-transferase CaiB-like acyl-CoA transferase
LTGVPGGEPVKAGVPVADFTAGLMSAYGVMVALFECQRSGRGQFVDISLLDSALSYASLEASMYLNDGIVAGPAGNAHRLAAPYQAFQSADGWVAIGVVTDAIWRRACAALDLSELADHPRWGRASERIAAAGDLAGVLAPHLRRLTTSQLLERFERHQVPCGPLLRMDGALEHPQVLAREMVVALPESSDQRVLGIPIKLSRTPGSIRSRPPVYGQHTVQVLAEVDWAGPTSDAGRALPRRESCQ